MRNVNMPITAIVQKGMPKPSGKSDSPKVSPAGWPMKESPLKSRGGRTDHDMGDKYWEAHKKTIHGMRDHSGNESPLKQTKADSTFIRKNHPVYTGGYMFKTFREMDEDEKLHKELGLKARPTHKMKHDHANANMFREKQAINRAKKTGIDVKKMKASDSPMKKISGACKTAAKKKFDVWPSAYASGWGVRCTKAGGPGKMGKSKK